MKMEDHFKETLKKAVANEPPVQDAWSRFERRIATHRRARLFASLAVAAAVIVAGAIVVPKLGHRSITAPTTNPPSASPSETSSPGATAGWNTYERPTDSYRVKYPTDWKQAEFEGHAEIWPNAFPGPQQGAPTVFVDVSLLNGDYRTTPIPSSTGVPVSGSRPTGLMPNGHPYVKYATDGETVWYVDWTYYCPAPAAGCKDRTRTLRVMVKDTSVGIDARYLETAQTIVDSIEFAPDQGLFAPEIMNDSLTTGLAHFMDARLAGSGAEPYLTEKAASEYRAGTGGLALYASGYRNYEVTARRDIDANSAAFDVVMSGATETITMGPGTNAAGDHKLAVVRTVSRKAK
jgi:hypothetical protein